MLVYSRDVELTPIHIEMADTVRELLAIGGDALIGDKRLKAVFSVKCVGPDVFRVSRRV